MSAIIYPVLRRLGSLAFDGAEPIIASRATEEAKLFLGSAEEAASFVHKLNRLHEGLQDAEKKQVRGQAFKFWLQCLKDVMYMMDDTLDNWQILYPQQNDVEHSVWQEKVHYSLIQYPCLCFRCRYRQHQIIREMHIFSKKLDELLVEMGGMFNLDPISSSETKPFMPPETTSKVDAKTVFGRDSDLKKLLSALLDQDDGESTSTSIRVVSLVGAGGLGKTTLSQLVYKHQRVDDHFEQKLWVSVSKPFDASQVAREILRVAGQKVDENDPLETLTTRVENLVSNKEFLLVLDNVRWDDSDQWETLMNCLHGAPGSRILVTTREEDVAQIMTSGYKWINLMPLPDTECWEILNELALTGKTREEIDTLTPIGVNIAKKSGGFPLAAKVLGGMLACLKTEKQWREVLESPMLEHEDGVDQLLKVLNLSYNDLSPTLKLCFSSCAIFPKGDSIRRDELIRIWLSKGYLSLDVGAEKIQLEGEKCFNNLAMRSFFLEANDEFCKIHDVMHDFAILLAKNEYCYTYDGRTGEGSHLLKNQYSSLSEMRSFVTRNVYEKELFLVNYLKRVRLLILSKCHLKEIPEAIGKLIHLRYLDLSWNHELKELPETLCDLYHLQTLCLEYCYYLSMLPEGIDKLVNLRHILAKGCHKIKFSGGLKNLTCLWILDGYFKVGRGCSNKLGYLKNLNKLHGVLRVHIVDMNEEADVEEAKEAYLGKKDKIEELELKIRREVRRDVIEALLQPPCNLKRLSINGGELEWLSSSISLPSLEELTVFVMYGRSLGIWGINNCGGSHLGNRGVSAGFSNLKRLTFDFCPWWEKWEDIGENELDDGLPAPIFPHLQILQIIDCDRLEVLPHNLIRKLSSLQTLEISYSECLLEVYRKGGLYRHNISHIPNIYIRYPERRD